MPDCATLLATAEASDITLAAAEQAYNIAYVANVDAWMNYMSQCMNGAAAAEAPKYSHGREYAERIWTAMPEGMRKAWGALTPEERLRFIRACVGRDGGPPQ